MTGPSHSRRTATTTEASAEQSLAYASSWSLHPEEIVALAVPEFVGVSGANADWARGTYWGRNPFKGNHEYVGIVVLLLAGVSFFGGAQKSLRFFLLALGGVALLFALGGHTPVWRIFYEVVPGIELFRSPSLAIFLFGFSAVTLMALGVEHLLNLEGKGSEADWTRPGRFLWAARHRRGLCQRIRGAALAGKRHQRFQARYQRQTDWRTGENNSSHAGMHLDRGADWPGDVQSDAQKNADGEPNARVGPRAGD